MLENIKLDIIYYNTPKDFEVEFNLCGCCRMRLLTATANDIKSFISAIKIAVARSRVVLLCGKLYGDDGLFSIISKAIGREFEEVDNAVYGIAGEGKSRLLKQSIPLVTSQGSLLGCVIEQGPQAIIMISEEKNGRKDIMQNLIHPYIKELSKSEPDIITDSETAIKEETETVSNPESIDIEENDESSVLQEKTAEIVAETPSESITLDEPETELETRDDDSELETVSLDDFTESTQTLQPEGEPDSEIIEEENSAFVSENCEEAENETNENPPAESNSFQGSDLIFGVSDEVEDESDSSVFSANDFKEYNENFSLIGPIDEEEESYYHRGRKRASSPIIPILICLVLCLAAIVIYFLLVKPLQAGVDIGENFNNLFSLALRM